MPIRSDAFFIGARRKALISRYVPRPDSNLNFPF